MNLRYLAAAVAASAILMPVSACSAGDDSGDGSTPESVQRDALDDAWDKVDVDERTSACDKFNSDPVGFSSSYFGSNFEYDVVKSFMEGKC